MIRVKSKHGAGGGGNRSDAGLKGFCICPSYWTEVAHQTGIPCTSVTCAKYGILMVRK